MNKESNKESNKKALDEKLIEIINPKKDEDTTDWHDKNKFKKILAIVLTIIQLLKHLLKKS